MWLSPQFGVKASKEELASFESSKQFDGQTFKNAVPTNMGAEFGQMMESLWEFIKGNPNRTPDKGVVSVLPVTKEELANPSNKTQILWFGHSTFLLQSQGKNYLFDPMFSDVPAPHPILGTKRYSEALPIEPEDLPSIDAVFISHDHYDHLDMVSIQKIANKTAQFYVPLGVGRHLQYWNVDKNKVTEMDWWEEKPLGDLTIAFTPARHFSGRGLTGQNTTLWGSWLVRNSDISLYFSGDTGYGPHFKEIYERYGAVDFALLECGQYNKNWADIHMMPEETVQAALDLQAKTMMPVHWGAFTLSLHDWNDPAIRVSKAAEAQNQAIVIPQIGEVLHIDEQPTSRTNWWANLTQQFAFGAQ